MEGEIKGKVERKILRRRYRLGQRRYRDKGRI
jgi:hypothetical protein